ncbi:MAG TPA: M56 family metallopeptidase [Vicinamibacterales bacterium]
MTPISILVKVSILLSVVALAQALLARRVSAATRHLIWTLATVGLLLLPMLWLVLPGWTAVRVPASTAPAAPVAVAPLDADSARLSTADADASPPIIVTPGEVARAVAVAGVPWAMALPVLYAAGLLFLLARLIGECLSVQRVARRAIPVSDPEWTRLLQECAGHVGIRRTVRLLRSREQTMPVAFGAWRAAILIPAVADMWAGDRRRAVLLHELAHVARFDCLTQLLTAVACALYWMHPGVWWMSRRLRLEREAACDDVVLATGTNAREYATHLLELAFALRGHQATALAVGIAGPRQLEERLLAVLDAARNRATPRLQTNVAGIAMIAVLLVTVATATITAVPPVPAGQSSKGSPATDGSGEPPAVESAQTGMTEGVPLTAAELIRARAHGVTPRYVSELGELGYAQLSLDALVRARDHGVSPEYIRDLTRLGYRLSLDDLIKARNHGVSPRYVSELRELGYSPLSLDTLVRARDHGVSPEYIRDLAQLGHRPSLDGLIKARDHGVSAEYIRALAALGYTTLSLDDLIRLRSHGVTAEYAGGFTTAASARPTVDELVAWRQQGVSSDRFRRVIDGMLAINVRQFVWHVRCASAWLQQMLNGATPATC